MTHILFICLGNICRSPLAEEVFRTLAEHGGRGKDFEIDSAGLIDYHEGELADERMRRTAAQRGYRLTHRSRPVTAADFRRFNYIVAMDAANLRGLARLRPADAKAEVMLLADYLTRHASSSIPDPYYGTAADFEHVVDLCEDACAELLCRLA